MNLIGQTVLVAAGVVALSGAACAQGYEPEVASEPMVEWSSAPTPRVHTGGADWIGPRHHRRHHARAHRIATPHVAFRAYAAPALPPMMAVAYTTPTRVVYAEPTPRTVYYNEPAMIVDGLRTHRAAVRVGHDRCGYGCLRAAY